MKKSICQECGSEFSLKIIHNNVPRYLCKRRYCFICQPFPAQGFRSFKDNKTEKTCRTCGEKLDRSLFYKYYKHQNRNCKKCYRIIENQNQRQEKQKMVDYKGGKCERCGYNKCIAALEFHHKDPTQKDFDISSGPSFKMKKMKNELDKCNLLCSNCHKEFHFSQEDFLVGNS